MSGSSSGSGVVAGGSLVEAAVAAAVVAGGGSVEAAVAAAVVVALRSSGSSGWSGSSTV